MHRARHFAFGRPRAFPVVGLGGVEPWRELLLHRQLSLGRGPRDADLLVLSGEIPTDWGNTLRALFETMALPRLVLYVAPGADTDPLPGLPPGYTASSVEGIDWTLLWERLLDSQGPSARALLADQPPTPWRGRGDHGQGGEGMMGGTPYGRPMAMTMEDPDQLALDDVPTALGPHFPGLPSGLYLGLRLQGDRVRQCEGVENRFPSQSPPPGSGHREPALRARAREAVPVADLEQARLRSHLGWLADLLDLCDRPGLAMRLREARKDLDSHALRRLLDRAESRQLYYQTRNIGVISSAQARQWRLAGPVARASGLKLDTRNHDPAYRELGFQPVVERGGDVWSRCRVRIRECYQSLDLLDRAGDAHTRAPEGARGSFLDTAGGGLDTPSARNLAALQPGLAGLEWHEAVLFVGSLDLDTEEAAWR